MEQYYTMEELEKSFIERKYNARNRFTIIRFRSISFISSSSSSIIPNSREFACND